MFVDIGANIGFYSVLVAKSGLAKTIFAFEPDERNKLQLSANLLINRLGSTVKVFNQAVSSSSGTISFAPSADTTTGKSKVGRSADAVIIQAVKLDDVIQVTDNHLFIKMDIEGHELEAVQGMKQTLLQNKIFMQIESFPENAPELKQFLSTLGIRQIDQVHHDLYFSNF